MRIWIFHNYSMLPEHGQLNRAFYYGKYLKKEGYEPVVFVGSHPHNTEIQLIENKDKFRVFQEKPFPWVLVKTCKYGNSKLKRVFSMFQFYINGKCAARHFEIPDAILGSSAHPLAAYLAIKLSKKYGTKSIVEVRDFWPESIVAYGIASRNNFVIRLLYKFEESLYKNADAVVFTMEGGYNYIKERGLQDKVPQSKVFYLNNGVDLEAFDEDNSKFQFDDSDLDNPELFKIVYTGSIRKVNNLGKLLDVAKEVKNPKVKFLIWGAGDETDMLQERIINEGISNVCFKGKVAKKYIPGIVSRADLNFAHNDASPMIKYGLSFNKMFEYLAAGKPVLFDFPCDFNPAVQHNAGISVDNPTIEQIAKTIDEIAVMESNKYKELAFNARRTAELYDYKNLARKLAQIVETEI